MVEENNIWDREVIKPFLKKAISVTVPHEFKESSTFTYFGRILQLTNDSLLLQSHKGNQLIRIEFSKIIRIATSGKRGSNNDRS